MEKSDRIYKTEELTLYPDPMVRPSDESWLNQRRARTIRRRIADIAIVACVRSEAGMDSWDAAIDEIEWELANLRLAITRRKEIVAQKAKAKRSAAAKPKRAPSQPVVIRRRSFAVPGAGR